LRVAGCGLLVTGCALRVTGCGLLVTGCWLRVAGYGLRVTGYGLLVAGCWLRVTGYGLLVAGCGTGDRRSEGGKVRCLDVEKKQALNLCVYLIYYLNFLLFTFIV
jgi:hypothetical protein